MLWLFKLEKRICSILCALVWFGPLVILVGGIVILSPDTRTIAINKYNSAVDDWTNTYRDEFASSFININESVASFNLTTSADLDVLKDKDSRIKSYVPLKYFIPLQRLIPPKLWNTPNSTLVNFRVNSTIFYTENVTIMQQNIIPVCCDSTPCTECTSYGGMWDGVNCWGVYVLTDYCIKMDVDKDTNTWSPERDPGSGLGCGLDGTWSTQLFAHINPSSSTHYDYSGNFTIRSSHDPYIEAAKLTGGSFNFGLTKAEKLRIGFLLIICGGIFMIPVVIIFFVCCNHMRKKHRHLHGVGTYSSLNN